MYINFDSVPCNLFSSEFEKWLTDHRINYYCVYGTDGPEGNNDPETIIFEYIDRGFFFQERIYVSVEEIRMLLSEELLKTKLSDKLLHIESLGERYKRLKVDDICDGVNDFVCRYCGKHVDIYGAYPYICEDLMYKEDVYADNSPTKTVGYILCKNCYDKAMFGGLMNKKSKGD